MRKNIPDAAVFLLYASHVLYVAFADLSQRLATYLIIPASAATTNAGIHPKTIMAPTPIAPGKYWQYSLLYAPTIPGKKTEARKMPTILSPQPMNKPLKTSPLRSTYQNAVTKPAASQRDEAM